MKKADPSIKILVFDECDFYPDAYRALCGGRLDVTGKDANGNWIINGFTFHRYLTERNTNAATLCLEESRTSTICKATFRFDPERRQENTEKGRRQLDVGTD